MKKQGNEVAIKREASLAATAWNNLEAAATKAMNGNGSASMRLFADTAGITAHISDKFGTQERSHYTRPPYRSILALQLV
jgi:hypothetical protein